MYSERRGGARDKLRQLPQETVVEKTGELLEALIRLRRKGNQQPSPEVSGKVQRLCTCYLNLPRFMAGMVKI